MYAVIVDYTPTIPSAISATPAPDFSATPDESVITDEEDNLESILDFSATPDEAESGERNETETSVVTTPDEGEQEEQDEEEPVADEAGPVDTLESTEDVVAEPEKQEEPVDMTTPEQEQQEHTEDQ